MVCLPASIRVLKWPDSMQMELWEKGTFLDSLVAEFFVAVPGLGGSPHVDPQAKPHSWTSPKPVPHNRLMQAVASLQPLGVLPAVQAVSGPGQPLLQQPLATTAGGSRLGVGSPGRARAAAALDAGEPSPADTAASSSSSGNSAEQTNLVSGAGPDSSSNSSSTGFAAMYPSGRLFVRCGWVADAGIEPHFTPFQHTDGPFGLGQSKQTALQQSLRLPDSSSFGDDGLVQVNITGRPGAAAPGSGIGRRLGSAPASPSKQQAGDYLGTAAFTNPLAFYGTSSQGAAGASSSPGASPRKGSRFGGAAGLLGADVMIGNPLAYLGEDVEVGQTLAPPLPCLKADRALQRVAQGVGHKVRPPYTGLLLAKCAGMLCRHRVQVTLLAWVIACVCKSGTVSESVPSPSKKSLQTGCAHACLSLCACTYRAVLPASGCPSTALTPTTNATPCSWSC